MTLSKVGILSRTRLVDGILLPVPVRGLYTKKREKGIFLLYLNHGEVLTQIPWGVCPDDRGGAVGWL